MADIEVQELRQAFGAFATGVTIVTTRFEGKRFGVTANSFSSVSLDPPMVLWSLSRGSSSFAAFENAPAFAVHILAADQQDLSNRFASKGIDKFEGLDTTEGLGGAPLLPECAARFECRTVYRYEGGDHLIFVGEIAALDHAPSDPLLFHGGKYAKRARDEEAVEGDPVSTDLSALVARAYFYLLTPVRARAADAGVALAEHYALTILMNRGDSTLAEINDVIGYSGVTIGAEALAAFVERGLVTQGADPSSRISLTPAGRTLMIELIASARALEADAQLDFEPDDARLLKLLLGRLVAGLETRGDARVARHMDLMRSVGRSEEPSHDAARNAPRDPKGADRNAQTGENG